MVYLVQFDREVTLEDTEDATVVKTIKGATLTLITDKLHYHSCPFSTLENYIFEDPNSGTKYCVDINYHDCSSDFEPLEIHSGWWDIAKLVDDPDLRRFSKHYGVIPVPKNMITARLHYYWEDDIWYDSPQDKRHERSAHFTFEGEIDDLYTRICEFVTEEK